MKTLSLSVPADFELARDYCSYGYFLLAPNRWVVPTKSTPGSVRRHFSIERVVFEVDVTQKGPGEKLKVLSTRSLSDKSRATVERWIRRMLRLDESREHLAAFHKLDPRWRKSGRGRLMRSPTMFEDVIKTVTSCNVTWPGTVQMNLRLCEVIGGGAFPDPSALSKARAETLRARCRVGYRDQRLIELARMFKSREIDTEWFEDPATPDDAVHDALVDLPGVGPYAAANIMQLLGRYSRLPLDTESVRHGKMVLGMDGSSNSIMKRIKDHFAPFGEHAFRSYWFELWEYYESKHGPSWTWERDSTGKLFTAAQLTKPARAPAGLGKKNPAAKPRHAPKPRKDPASRSSR